MIYLTKETLRRWQTYLVSMSETSHIICQNQCHSVKLCEDENVSLHTKHCKPETRRRIICHANNYLIETHDILGGTARKDRGKDGILGEKRN